MPQLDDLTLEKELREIIARITEIDPARIALESKFVEDLGMDSMMALEIMAKVEKSAAALFWTLMRPVAPILIPLGLKMAKNKFQRFIVPSMWVVGPPLTSYTRLALGPTPW